MRKVCIILFTVLIAGSVNGQQNMTLYQMHDIPQSNSLNPAVPISCGWIVGFPVLGSISLGARSPLSYNDLGAGENTLYVNDLKPKLRNKNVLSANGSVNLITVGYRSERMFYQLTVNERFFVSASIPKDPLVMLMEGNAGYIGKVVSGSPAASGYHYREYAFNIAREIDPSLWVGARPKLMFGRVGAKTSRNTADFYTDPRTYNLELTTDLQAHMSFPGTVTIDPLTGKVDGFESDAQASDFIFNTANIGFGIDLGVTKTFDNDINFSASILNLGFIKWSKNTHTLEQVGTLSFRGPFSPVNEFDALKDTLESFMKFDYAQGGFTQVLSPTFMVGANYPVHQYIRVGATGLVEWHPNAFPWALTATAFTAGLPIVDVGLSYTVTAHSFANIGIGLAVHLGAADIHFTTDNLIGLMRPFNARYATAQFGINFRFGCGEKSEKSRGAKNTQYRKASPLNKMVPCPQF